MNYNENCVTESSSSTEDGTPPPGEMLYPHTFGQGDSQYSSSILANIPSLPGMMSQQLAPTLYHNNASAASAASTSSAEGMVPVGLLAYWQQQALRLQQQVQNSKQKGRGRNKRNHHQNATDLSNKTAVRLVTRNQIWPKHKLLNIKGNFKQYDPTKPHPFPKFMMRQVSVRDGDEARYYEDEVLPEVSATLSICRNNTVKEMKKAFKNFHGTWSPQQLEDSKDMCSEFLTHIDDWSGLAHDEEGMTQLCRLIYYFVCEVRTKSKVKAWANQNKQSSVLDYFTPSDVAFALFIIESYTPVWVEDMLLLREAQAESVAQDRPAKKKKLSKKQKMYQKDISVHKKLPYLSTQWSKEGYKRLENLTNSIAQLKKSDTWKHCISAWNDFVRQKRDDNSETCWVPLFEESVRSDDDYDECEDDDYGEGVEFEEPSDDFGVPLFEDSFTAFVCKQQAGV